MILIHNYINHLCIIYSVQVLHLPVGGASEREQKENGNLIENRKFFSQYPRRGMNPNLPFLLLILTIF